MNSFNKQFILFLTLLASLLSSCNSNKGNDFKKQIAVKEDILYLDNSKDTIITGSKGTLLYFPRHAFTFQDGSEPKGSISIVLNECLTPSNMIRENLSTMAGSQLLETRGMVNIKAFANGKELNLKKGKTFIIHFPKDTSEKDKTMAIFYGNIGKNENINWQIDTQSILKPTIIINGSGESWTCDINSNEDFFRLRDDTKSIDEYIKDSFDISKLTLGNKLINKNYLFSFTKGINGDLKNKKIIEINYPNLDPVKNPEIDPYVIKYFKNFPPLNPKFCRDKNVETEGYIEIGFAYRPDYKNNIKYNQLFNRKYAVFKNSNIKMMNDAELNYYIFSCSKLGWINCDYFWDTKDERINYIVKIDPNERSDVKLVFKNAKSIMPGSIEGDKCIFHNVPINQEVKIVAIKYKGDQPLLSIAETKTSKTPFNNLQYKEFSLTELEKNLSIQN